LCHVTEGEQQQPPPPPEGKVAVAWRRSVLDLKQEGLLPLGGACRTHKDHVPKSATGVKLTAKTRTEIGQKYPGAWGEVL
jgi:hypothetical protein